LGCPGFARLTRWLSGYRPEVSFAPALHAPRALLPGSRLVVVAPSSPFEQEPFAAGLALLRARYEVICRTDVIARDGFLAGDDARRLTELQDAIKDDSVDAIVAARGGYGATRLIDRLDLSALGRRPKLLVGFSDITALHALWARAGVRSVHGVMVASLGVASLGAQGALAAEQLCAVLEGHVPEPCVGLTDWTEGRVRGAVEGVLLGGNLTVLTALIGTPYFPSLAGAVLFLEDVGERPYRVDRMLTTWRQAGVLRGVAGVVLGAFTNCDPGPDGRTVEDVLRMNLSALGVPVVSGLRAGHVDDNQPLPFGAPVELDVTADVGRLTFLGGACELG